MPIKPLGKRVLIRPSVETTTPGGLILVESAQEKPIIGEVLDVGPDVTEVTPGETVVYRKYAGTEVQHEGERFLLIPENDLIGTLEA